MRLGFLLISFVILALICLAGWLIWAPIWLLLILFVPLIIIGCIDLFQTKHALRRNFPLIGRTRYMLEWARPKIYQYFIEPDHDGRPFSRIFRSIVYQRAKKVLDTAPFGTQMNVYAEGYEWMNHSINALDHHALDQDPRVLIGNQACSQPYSCSLFNVSAMSFGSLSKNAILALNHGARIGRFAHNTGEGGVSPYHFNPKGDLIYQIGTGYFGCRTPDGNFDPDSFKELTQDDRIKMIELKLSQGAKPGHGGILPGKKVTKEIAAIRGIKMGKDVLSPPYHKMFNTPLELMDFIAQMRLLSGGKPIGIKLCIGHKSEFISICKAIIKTGVKPDFISIDGGEGGTGAAPLEFSNSVGMPFKEGLAFAYDSLVGFGLKPDIKLMASGKIVTGFHIFRALALGADACSSARAMMMAVGCIQALECNKNTCPTGVATQDEHLIKGLVVSDKSQRVANYHRETVEGFVELMAAAGIRDPDQINRSHISRRLNHSEIKRYDEIYPYLNPGDLLKASTIPAQWKKTIDFASIDKFMTQPILRKYHL